MSWAPASQVRNWLGGVRHCVLSSGMGVPGVDDFTSQKVALTAKLASCRRCC